MRKLCLLIAVIVFPAVAIAQNYDSYLKEAVEHLEQGNVEGAKRAYLVYQRMTGLENEMFKKKLINVVFEQPLAKAVEEMKTGRFANADLLLKTMEPMTPDNEIQLKKVKETLKDSVENTFNRANELKEAKKYQLAIIEYQKLAGQDNPPLRNHVYSYIGYCYESLSNHDLAKQCFMDGIKYGENLSAYYLAWYTKRKEKDVTSEKMIELYLNASNYYAIKDSLGVEYGRLRNYNESYKWFKDHDRSKADSFCKYKMASYLLDKEISVTLDDIYKTDDPIKLLTDAADDGYAPAQYYLGLLYYFAEPGDIVQMDRKKGFDLVQKASLQGYKKAKSMLWKIKE